jgi:DNA-binding response OmpR family regulator
MWDGLNLDEQASLLQVASGKTNTIPRILTRKAILTSAGKIFSPLFGEVLTRKIVSVAPAALRFGDGYAALGNQLIKLSPIEAKLFEYLYNHAGQVCSREEILRRFGKENSSRRIVRLQSTWLWRVCARN